MRLVLLTVVLLAAPVFADGTVEEEEIILLIDRLGSAQFSVREAATTRLIEIGEPAIKLLRESKDDEDLEVRWRVRKILVRLGALVDPKVLAEIKQQMAITVDETRPLPVRQAAQQRILDHGDQALAAMFHVLHEKDYRMRRHVTELALAFSANKQVIPLLLNALHDEDRFVQSGARKALVTLTGQSFPSYATDKWKAWWKANKGSWKPSTPPKQPK